MIKRICILLFCTFFCTSSLWSQKSKVDSLKVILEKYESDNEFNTNKLADSTRANLLIKIGSAYGFHQPSEAVSYVKKALEISKKIGHKRGIANAKFQIGRIQSDNKQTNKSIQTTYEAIALYRELGDSLKIADCYNNIGVIYATTGNYVWAVAELFKAINIYEKLNVPLIVINGYANIGTINKILGNLELSKFYYEKSLNLAKGKLEFLPEFAGIYLNLGKLNYELKDYAQSELMYGKALKCLVHNPDEYLTATIYNSKAENAIVNQKYKRAFKYLYSAKNTFETIDSDNGLVEVLINLGKCYLKTNHLAHAEKYIVQSIVIAEEFEMISAKIKAYKCMILISERKGDFKKAYEFQKKYKALSDKQFDMDNENKMIQMQMQYDFDKLNSNKKEARLFKEIDLRENTAKTLLIKYVSSIILIILLIFALFILKHLHKNIKQKNTIQNYNDLLNQQNQAIQLSLVQKNILLKEIHHRVKNNLQIITSLLTIQANDTQDYQVVDLIEIGLSKIQSMSSIHETLFLFEHLDEINLHDYFEKLLIKLGEMYGKENTKFTYIINTQNVLLNINTAIPLGLIINELVTNSFKHSKLDQEEIEIQILLKPRDFGNYELTFIDNISFISSDTIVLKDNTFGINMVKILCEQINGKLEICTKPSLSYKISFSNQ